MQQIYIFSPSAPLGLIVINGLTADKRKVSTILEFPSSFLCIKMLLAEVPLNKVALKMVQAYKIKLLHLLIFNDDRACENRKKLKFFRVYLLIDYDVFVKW